MNSNVNGLDYGRIADLLVQQLATDDHSLNDIPQAVFHIQAHGLDNNKLRLTYPGLPLFPTRALAIVGYNTYGLMSYCNLDFNENVTINDTSNNSYSINIRIKSDGDIRVPVQLPPGETITETEGKKAGFIPPEIKRLNEGKIVNRPIGSDGGKISIDQALLIATTRYYSFIEELKKRGIVLDEANLRRTLLKLHERMYHRCGIRNFPNCRDRKVSGFYKDIYYVYEKAYVLSENPGENTVCEITTEQGTQMEVRMPKQLSPYGLYIMYSTLKHLYDMPVRVSNSISVNTNSIIEKIRRIYETLFGSTPSQESDTEICMNRSNIMYNGNDMPGTYTDKVPELFYNIIKLRLESDLFQALIPDETLREQIANHWLILADMDRRQLVPFSYLQFYLSYILLLDVSIIDGSCRSSHTKSALISPTFSSEVGIENSTMSNVRLLLQNKTADIISTVTTDTINKRIEKFSHTSSREEQRESIYKWIHIFNKRTFQEMLNTLRSPWFNYTPISTDPSHLNTFATSAMKPEETKKAIKKMEEEEEKEYQIYERQQEFLRSIEEELSDKINPFLQRSGLEETYPNIKQEIVEVIINKSFLDPSAISDEEIQTIIDNIITRNLQLTQKARGRTSRQTSTRPLPGIRVHRGRKEVSNEPEPRKSRRLSKGGYKSKKRVKRNKKTRIQKTTKNKRKITHKQY